MTDEFFDRVVTAIRAELLAAGHQHESLDVDTERRKVRLPLPNGARFSMTRVALADLGNGPEQIASAFLERYRTKGSVALH